MTIPKFRATLPEDQLSEKERDQRIHKFDEFSKKLQKERKKGGLDDPAAIRQLLIYIGKRLELLDLENKHARLLARFDYLQAKTTKPVPQSLVGVVADATLNLGLKDTEKVIKKNEKLTRELVVEITSLAPEINKILDLRQAEDKDDLILRPTSCLPEAAVHVEATKGGAQKSKPTQRMAAAAAIMQRLEQLPPIIKHEGESYGRNHLADKMMKISNFTPRQREVAVLFYGYEMTKIAAIATFLKIDRKTVSVHKDAANKKLAVDPNMKYLLLKHNSKSKRFDEEDD